MATVISFGERHIQLSNRHFSNLLEFTFASADVASLTSAEAQEVHRFEEGLESGQIFPGQCFEIEEDFPATDQQKLWARLFADTARAIFRREVGAQSNTCWQARAITQAMQLSDLFVHAAQHSEKGWYPQTKDQIERAGLSKSGAC